MTDGIQAENLEVSASVNSDNNSKNVTNSSPSERMVPQSEVDKAIHAVKLRERERAKQEALEDFKKQQQEVKNEPYQSQTSMGGMQYLSPDEVKKMIEEHDKKKAEELHSKNMQMEANKLASDFETQLTAAREKYSDFSEMEKQLDAMNNPRLAPLIIYGHKAGISNMGDVMYDLWKNPTKVASLAGTLSDEAAIAKLREYSETLKKNDIAKSQPKAREPLSQLTATMTAMDNGSRTVGDWRKASWLKG